MIDRLSLIQILNGIPIEQLLQVIFTLKPPSGIIPPNNASQGQQVFALLQWAEGASGCGLGQVQAVLDTIIKSPVNHSNEQTQVQPQPTIHALTMNLSGSELRKLVEAIISAYPTKEDLAMMVQFELEENLNVIAGGGKLRRI